MKIPFAGEVCPHCLRQKNTDQTGTVATGVGLLMGGFIGSLVGGLGGMLIGGFLLGLLAAFVSMSGKNHTARKPPRLRVDGFAPIKPDDMPEKANTGVADATKTRLFRLADLRARDVLSAQEHQDQRKAIIARL